MIKKLLAISIMCCVLVWAQDVSRSIGVTDEVSKVIEKPNIGVVKVEEVKTTDGDRGVPYKVNFQGYLTDNGGQPINGSASMVFTIFTAQSGGTQAWTSGTQTVPVSNGLFNKVLSISYSAFEPNQARWMEVKVNSQTLNPRIEITSSPWSYTATKSDTSDYAYNSDKLDGYHYTDFIRSGQSAGGDLSGTFPNPVVDGLQNRAVSSAAPTSGYVLKWSGSQWAPAQDNTGGSGTVTSISQGTGIICSPNPISTTGTISFNTGYTVPDAGRVDGYDASSSATAGDLLPLDGNGRFIVNTSGSAGPKIYGGNTSCPWGVQGQGNTSNGIGVLGTGYYGVYADGNFGASGTKSAIIKTSHGLEKIYCLEGLDVEVYCSGSGQLMNGEEEISFERLFTEAISSTVPIKVIVTPTAMCNGIAVISKGNNSFKVKELQNGTNNATFDWIAIGRRKEYETRPQTTQADINAWNGSKLPVEKK